MSLSKKYTITSVIDNITCKICSKRRCHRFVAAARPPYFSLNIELSDIYAILLYAVFNALMNEYPYHNNFIF